MNTDVNAPVAEAFAPADQVQYGEKAVVSRTLIKRPAGQTVIMPADVPHALKATKRFKMLLTMIRS